MNVAELSTSGDPRISVLTEKNQTWIILDDPATLNALDPGLVRSLAREVEAVKSGRLIITGRNGAFSSGGSLETVSSLASQVTTDRIGVEAIIREGGNLIEDILFSPATTIALIDGVVAGAGIGIALACDIQLATHRTRYNTAYAALGLPSDFGTHELLRQRIGEDEADELMKNPELVGITRAQELGLVDAVIDRVDPKLVRKTIKAIPVPDRKAKLKSMSAVLDTEAAQFAQALSNPKVQVQVEKLMKKKRR